MLFIFSAVLLCLYLARSQIDSASISRKVHFQVSGKDGAITSINMDPLLLTDSFDQAFAAWAGAASPAEAWDLMQVHHQQYIQITASVRDALRDLNEWILCDYTFVLSSGQEYRVQIKNGQDPAVVMKQLGLDHASPGGARLLHDLSMCVRLGERRHAYVETIPRGFLTLGSTGVEAVLPFMAHVARQAMWASRGCGDAATQAALPVLLFDVGANIGQTVDAYMSMLVGSSCFPACDPEVRARSTCAHRIYAFEPIESTYEALRGHYNLGQEAADLRLIRSAVGLSGVGQMTFYRGVADVDASQDPAASGHLGAAAQGGAVAEEVPYVSLDEFAAREGIDREVFLVKVDTEGYDADVLMGAEGLLNRGLIKFLVFEVNMKWFTVGRRRSLEDMARWLEARDYVCFMLHPHFLVPISIPLWAPEMETRYWSNCLCGRRRDKDLRRLVLGFDKAGDGDLSLWVVKQLGMGQASADGG